MTVTKVLHFTLIDIKKPQIRRLWYESVACGGCLDYFTVKSTFKVPQASETTPALLMV